MSRDTKLYSFYYHRIIITDFISLAIYFPTKNNYRLLVCYKYDISVTFLHITVYKQARNYRTQHAVVLSMPSSPTLRKLFPLLWKYNLHETVESFGSCAHVAITWDAFFFFFFVSSLQKWRPRYGTKTKEKMERVTKIQLTKWVIILKPMK